MFRWTPSNMDSEGNVIKASEAALRLWRKPVTLARSMRQGGEGHVWLDNVILMCVFLAYCAREH